MRSFFILLLCLYRYTGNFKKVPVRYLKSMKKISDLRSSVIEKRASGVSYYAVKFAILSLKAVIRKSH